LLQVTWPSFLQTARVRAVEETDAEGSVWDGELRREVTREAAQKMSDMDAFLDQRAALLAKKGRYASIASALSFPAVPPWLVSLGWAAAFVLGWWLAALGQESEINLLALPLILILGWNAVVVLWSLWPGLHKPVTHDHDWRENLLKRFDRRTTPLPQADPWLPTATVRFRERVRGPALERLACRFRAWLHIGAALLALGSISAMYARGWSKEYRAVWESTLLNEAGATKFFRAMFSPASVVTGQGIPLDELPEMRRRPGEAARKPGDALPWIHLYAATLGLFVLIPRVLLTLLEISRAKTAVSRALGTSDWQAYAHRLRSLAEGAGAPALILTHGLAHDTAAQDRWRHWAYLHWRDVGPLAFESVPLGGETEFVNAFVPSNPRVMLVFNMAATPETEVQRALVHTLGNKLKESQNPGANLLLALDDVDLRKRWAGFGDLPARLAERSAAWSDAMKDSDAVWHEVVMPAKHTPSPNTNR
jgi:hypothetical protein